MLEFFKQDPRMTGGEVCKCLAWVLLGFVGLVTLVVIVTPYVSPFVLCPPLLLALILIVRAVGRRRLWEPYGKMPPLEREDLRRVRSNLIGKIKPNRPYERRLRVNSGRDRGLARF